VRFLSEHTNIDIINALTSINGSEVMEGFE